jgi:hypothetical protein
MGSIELQPLRGLEVAPGGQRRRVMAGEGLVQPKAPTTFRDPVYGLLTFRPGRDRLSPRHPAVRANPLGFEAVWAKDVATRSVIVTMQERHVKSGGRTRAGVRSRGSTRLWHVEQGSATGRSRGRV